MGLYISSFDLTGLNEIRADAFSKVDRCLQSAGFQGLDEVVLPDSRFEEKLSVDPSSFEDLCDNVLPGVSMLSLRLPPGASDQLFPVEGADLILPLRFRGLLEVRDLFITETLGIASAHQLKIQIDAMTEASGSNLAAAPALSPGGYAFNHWYDEMTSSEFSGPIEDPTDPDTLFHLALYGAVADYCVHHNAAARISQ